MRVRYWWFSLEPYGAICPPCAWVEGYSGHRAEALPALITDPYLCRRCGRLEHPAPEMVRDARKPDLASDVGKGTGPSFEAQRLP